MINMPFVCNAFTCYTSKPFRKPIYDAKLFLFTIVGNLIAAIVFFFYTDHFPTLFYFVGIPHFESGMVLLISSASIILSYIVVEVYKRKFAE